MKKIKRRNIDLSKKANRQHVVSFSGGKDSTAMLLMMIEHKMRIDKIIFVDTTKEFPDMYNHIQKVQQYITPLKIEFTSFDYDYWFYRHKKIKGATKGQYGYGFPSFYIRWCSGRKIRAFNKAISNTQNKIITYIGIAYDEQKRTQKKQYKKRIVKYPLIKWGVTGKKALEYCYSKGFNWNGLYEKFHRVSCWCCPLSRISELQVLYNDFPELWLELKEMEKKSDMQFKPDYTVKELEKRFLKEKLNYQYKKEYWKNLIGVCNEKNKTSKY